MFEKWLEYVCTTMVITNANMLATILLKCLYNFSDVVAIGEYTLHACGQSENTVHNVMLSTCKLVKKKV